MARGMASIAERNQIRRVVEPAGGTRNEMVNICFALRASVAALPAAMCVPCQNYLAHVAPALSLLQSCRTRHIRRPQRSELGAPGWHREMKCSSDDSASDFQPRVLLKAPFLSTGYHSALFLRIEPGTNDPTSRPRACE